MNKSYFTAGWLALFCLFQLSCSPEKNTGPQSENQPDLLFTSLTPTQSGIDFTNLIKEDQNHHYFYYPYLYNGGGVAAGDINNDGLPDLYFSGNQVPDELYVNKGELSFQKITKAAGIKHSKDSWHTGVAFWDANADGFLDIYVCRSGKGNSTDNRRNLLYINNGDETFKESAKAYGLDDPGYSTQAYPFDYDKDGDIDLYIVNHRVDFIKNSYYDFEDDKKIEFNSSDHLYRNNGNNTFTEVGATAGIHNKAWGLSAAIGDINGDGWEDVYVANDFHQPDYLYINNKNGTFSEQLSQYFKHTSFYSMGSDLADINNDGLPDLMVLDMVSESHLRSKRMMAAMSTDNFKQLVKAGYHYQYMVNALQLNQGKGHYSEIGQLAGVSKTDWSWAPLFADLDNDGWKDLFVTNGIKKDVTDNDFRIEMEKELKDKGSLAWDVAMKLLPSSTISNYVFRNNGNLKFENKAEAWGMSEPVNSNGVAYADLDLDGDLELILNNMEKPSLVYKNNSQDNKKGNYLTVSLNGPALNPFAIGTKVYTYTKGKMQYQNVFPCRGFQSSVDYNLHFGLGNFEKVDSLVVNWPDGKTQLLKQIMANQKINVRYNDAAFPENNLEKPDEKSIFAEATKALNISFEHKENDFDDFYEEVLLPHKQSELGPMIATGDVNNDGLEDFFIGGAHQQAGRLLLQKSDGTFSPALSQAWEADRDAEDLGSLLFDADQDGDLDLYVVSGGAVFAPGSPLLQDRLYLNDGKGRFERAHKALPEMKTSGHSVCAGDFDGDGDTDLFVGGRLIPGKYPLSPRSYLLENKAGVFTDITDLIAPSLLNPGLVNDALFTDYDGDKDLDLILVGEWMPIRLYENQEGFFIELTQEKQLLETTGWWNTIVPVDIDKDGDEDYVIGNVGNNNKFHPKIDQPLHIYTNDFDHNGTLDIYLAKEKDKIKLPIRGRECSSQQMPGITQKFPTYKEFGLAHLEDILGTEEIESAFHLEAKTFSSGLLINDRGNLTLHRLPVEAQFSSINGIIAEDFNGDGYPDLLVAGNNYGTEVETVRYDASTGLLLYNDQKGGFHPVSNSSSGFLAPWNVKSLTMLKTGPAKDNILILVGSSAEAINGFIHETSK